MADGYVGDAYIECQHYTVLSEHLLDELWPPEWGEISEGTTYCYCGEEANWRAKVAFHKKMRDDEEYGWGNSISMEHTVDRCDDHRFGHVGSDSPQSGSHVEVPEGGSLLSETQS